MSCGCYMLVASIALIALGGQGCYSSIAHREARVVSYEQFVKEKPEQGWFKVTGCAYDVRNCYVLTKKYKGSDTESWEALYIPVYSEKTGPLEDEKTVLLLKTEDEELIALKQQHQTLTEPLVALENEVQALEKRTMEAAASDREKAGKQAVEGLAALEKKAGPAVEKLQAFDKANKGKLEFAGTVEGTIQFGLDSQNTLEFNSHKGTDLDEKYRVIALNSRPDALGSALMLIGGLLLLAINAFFHLAKNGAREETRNA